MKHLHVVIYLLISCFSSAQADSIHFYSLEELKFAHPDTVLAISLKKQKLTVLPEELFRFTKIRYLDLEKNELEDLSRLGEFTELVYLNVGKNKLINFPIAICQLRNIEELILNRNDFSYIPPCINYCQKLTTIDLWETPVTSLSSEMQSIPSLKSIDFSGVRMNPTQQRILKEQFPKVKFIFDTPCDCLY